MEELLELALDRPDRAEALAEELLVKEHDPLTRAYAYQALGIVLRDRGRTAEAVRMLRAGTKAAVRSGDADRERDVRATLGTALVLAGRARAGIGELDAAMNDARGEAYAKVAMRKAAVLTMLGTPADAIPVLERALVELRLSSNRRWQAKTLVWLCQSQQMLGNLDAAESALIDAADLMAADGSWVDQLLAKGNLAEIAALRGDLATALKRYREATAAFNEAGQEAPWGFVVQSARTHVSAGLAADAVQVFDDSQINLSPLDGPEFELYRADVLLAAGQLERAAGAARSSRNAFRAQRRPWFERRARLAEVRTAAALGRRAGLSRRAEDVAHDLHEERADEAPVALTLAGRLVKGEQRGELWRQAASYRTHPNALVRAAAWLARALEREEAGDGAGALRACRAGLDAIDEQRRLLGSSELRAQATTHGRELTEVALRTAAAEPRRLLRWAERTRATTLAQPAMTSDAATIPESLAALRDNGRQLAEARQAGEPTERLERERLRLERAVRAESHTVSATGSREDRPIAVEEVVAGVGDGCLVEVVDVGGVLHVLVVHGGRVRRRIAGPVADSTALLDPIAMLLRRSARGRPASTEELGRRLQEAILGDAVRLIPDGPVVLAPTTHLHGLPWSVLPVLADRPFSVVPSAGQWLRARAVRRPADRRTVLVSGPGLASGGAEVPLLAEQHPSAHLLAGRQATLDAVLAGLDGADLVHLAAHGHFRADSPLFSSLDLADGPLTVHDIERIGRAPYRVVLSACESGVLAPVGAQELLGLAAALFSLGTAGLVCSVAEVNDVATADLMVGLHAALARGEDPATALWHVRRDATDPVTAATASAFLAFGV